MLQFIILSLTSFLRSPSTLFEGQNNQTGQRVFSFVAPQNTTSLSQLNILPLFQYLVAGNRMPNSTYLGTAQFGTEAIHTDGKNVTFAATGIDMAIQAKSVPGAKSDAVSLTGLGGFGWCWVLLEGAMGAWLLWSWML